MESRKFAIGAFCLVLSLFMVQFVHFCSAISYTEASEALELAENDLNSAFVAVAEAESAGAVVSELLEKLNLAGVFLSESQSSFGAEDYDRAFSSATACIVAVEDLVGSSRYLKVQAETVYNDRLFLTAIGSSVGLALVLFLGFIFWRFIKRRYFKRTFEMKPKGVNYQ